MKKLFLGLFFFSAVLTVSASNEVVVLPANNAVTEIQNLELLPAETIAEAEPDRIFTCSLYVDGHWVTGSYECFFCWGGGHNGCIAALAKEQNIVM